jgi:hypothetical protein
MGASFMGALGRIESWMGTQAAQNWLLMANLLAVCIYVCFTRRIYHASDKQATATRDLARWQRRQWELDGRKQEWRELIEVLVRCADQIDSAKRTAQVSTFGPFAKEGAERLQRSREAARAVLSNRLYIRNVVEREDLENLWREVEEYYKPANTNFGDLTGFQEKWKHLHETLVTAAKTDLGIDRGEGVGQ